MSTWTINGSSPESLGLTVTRGQFASGSASQVELAAVRNFDASEIFAHNATVTINRDGSAFFKGKVRSIPKSGSADSESQDYVVEDAWADLERLTYQEPWLIKQSDYAGVIWSPKVILGMNSSGVRINVGEQIAEVLTFAIARGVVLQVGTMPTGMDLWPSEATGMNCAQIIRDCLRFYPDWLPWIDSSTTPPTFNVTPRASATAISVSVGECSTLDVTQTQDRVPTGVRIVYESVNQVDGEVYRTVAIDQAPRPGGLTDEAWKTICIAPAGLGMLVTPVELAGMQVQIQKQQVTVRELPTDAADAKTYLKEKFPIIKDLADSKFTVTEWVKALVPAPGDPAPEIDTKLERLYGTGLTGANGLTNELIDGSLPEWIGRRVGKVLVKFTVEKASGVTLTEEEEKALAQLPPWFHVVGTNAVTKIYKGISSYEPAEAVPVGIAAAFYATMISGCNYAGSITTEGEELPSDLGHGRVLNLTGSAVSAWATMKAPIHTVSWDLVTGSVTRQFGPNPDLSVEDFIEFLKLLNKRPYSSFTTDERTGDTLGNEGGVSARGDSVGPTWTPETVTGGGSGGGTEFSHPFKITTSTVEGVAKYKVAKGSIQDGTNGTAISLAGITETETTATAGYVVIEADVDADLVITGWALAIKSGATDAQEVGMTTTGDIRQNKIRLLIGKLTLDGAVATAWQAQFSSVRINVGLVNGVAGKVFEDAPTYPTSI